MNHEKQYFENVDLCLWEDNQPSIPLSKGKYKKSLKRWGHCSCIFGCFLYVFSGEIDSNQTNVSTSIHKICIEDIMNNMWSEVDYNLKGFELGGRDSFSSVLMDYKWLLFFGDAGGFSINEIISYDFSTQTFQKILTKKAPIARESHCSALLHQRFAVLYGGVTVTKKKTDPTDTSHKLSIYDGKEDVFLDLPDELITNGKHFKPRKCHSMTEFMNQLVVFGGSTITSVNKVIPEDLFSDMFLIKVDFFKCVDKNAKIDDLFFIQISQQLYVKFTFSKIEYMGPKLTLHSHNANVVGSDLVVFTCGETVIWDTNKQRVVCNTHVYAYSISINCMFEILTLADKMPKRVSGTSDGYLNGLLIYGGVNDHKKSLNTISMLTFNMKDRSVYPKTFSVDGKSANEMDDYEISIKRILYSMNRKNEIVNHNYAKKLFEKNQVL